MLITLWINKNKIYITITYFVTRTVDNVFNHLLTKQESGLALRAEDAVVNERVEENGKLLVDR